MPDTRYLQLRGRVWHLRVPHPPFSWGCAGEFVHTLGTADLRVAQGIRDKYLLPILAEGAGAGFVRAVAEAAARADRAAAEGLAAILKHLPGAPAGSLRLREGGDAFLAQMRAGRGHAPTSVRGYAVALDKACAVLGADLVLGEFDKAGAVRVRDALLVELSSRTVDKHLAALRRVFRWWLDEGRVLAQGNPFDGVGVMRVLQEHKRAPTAREAAALVDLPCPASMDRLTWEAMPLLARHTGARAGELSALRGEDLVEAQGIRCLRITAEGGRRLKTAGSERLVPVADRLADLLARLLARRAKGRLLDAMDWRGADGTVKGAHGFLKLWNRRAKAVGAGLSFHCWRVYFNDALATAGVDILDRERLLGHRSQRTQAAYTPENLRRLKAAVNRVP